MEEKHGYRNGQPAEERGRETCGLKFVKMGTRESNSTLTSWHGWVMDLDAAVYKHAERGNILEEKLRCDYYYK